MNTTHTFEIDALGDNSILGTLLAERPESLYENSTIPTTFRFIVQEVSKVEDLCDFCSILKFYVPQFLDSIENIDAIYHVEIVFNGILIEICIDGDKIEIYLHKA